MVGGPARLVAGQGCGCSEFLLGFVRGQLHGVAQVGYSHFVMDSVRYRRRISAQSCPGTA